MSQYTLFYPMNHAVADALAGYYDFCFHGAIEQAVGGADFGDQYRLYMVALGQSRALCCEAYDVWVEIQQPLRYFSVFNGVVLPYSGAAYPYSLNLISEYIASCNHESGAEELSSQALALYLAEKIGYEHDGLPEMLDLARIGKFRVTLQYKIYSREKLLYVDYAACFSDLPIKLDDGFVGNANLYFLVLRKRYAGSMGAAKKGMLEVYNFTQKAVYPLEQTAKIMIYFLKSVLDELQRYEQKNIGSCVSLDDLLVQLLTIRYALYYVNALLLSKEVSLLCGMLNAFLNYSRANQASKLPMLLYDDQSLSKLICDVNDGMQVISSFLEAISIRNYHELYFHYSLYEKTQTLHFPAHKYYLMLQQASTSSVFVKTDIVLHYADKMEQFCQTTLPYLLRYACSAIYTLKYTDCSVLYLLKLILHDIQEWVAALFGSAFGRISCLAKTLVIERQLAWMAVKAELPVEYDYNYNLFHYIVYQYYGKPSATQIAIALLIAKLHSFRDYYYPGQQSKARSSQFEMLIGFSVEEATMASCAPVQNVIFHIVLALLGYADNICAILKDGIEFARDECVKDISIYVYQQFKAIYQTAGAISRVFDGALMFIGFLNDVMTLKTVMYLATNMNCTTGAYQAGSVTIYRSDDWQYLLLQMTQQHISEFKGVADFKDTYLTALVAGLVFDAFSDYYKSLYCCILEGYDSVAQTQQLQLLEQNDFFGNEDQRASYAMYLNVLLLKLQNSVKEMLSMQNTDNLHYLIARQMSIMLPLRKYHDLGSGSIVDCVLEKQFGALAELLRNRLARFQLFIVGVYQQKKEKFDMLLSSSLEYPYNFKSLSKIVLFVQHIKNVGVENDKNVIFLQQMKAFYKSSEQVNLVTLASFDLHQNCAYLLSNFCEEWSSSRLNARFERLLNATILRKKSTFPDFNNTAQILNFPYEQQCFFESFPEGQLRLYYVLFASRYTYELNEPSIILKTSFELLAMSELLDIYTDNLQKYIIIAKHAQEIMPMIMSILRTRARIIQVFSTQIMFQVAFVFSFIDLEEKLARLSVSVTWSSFRAVFYCQKLEYEYTQYLQTVQFYAFKLEQIYIPFVYMRELAQVSLYPDAEKAPKLSFRQLQMLFLKKRQLFYEYLSIHYDNLKSFGALVARYLDSVSRFSFLFVVSRLAKEEATYLTGKLTACTIEYLAGELPNVITRYYINANLYSYAQAINKRQVDKQLMRRFMKIVRYEVVNVVQNGKFDFYVCQISGLYSIMPTVEVFVSSVLHLMKSVAIYFAYNIEAEYHDMVDMFLFSFGCWLRQSLSTLFVDLLKYIQAFRNGKVDVQVSKHVLLDSRAFDKTLVYYANYKEFSYLYKLECEIEAAVQAIESIRHGSSSFNGVLDTIRYLNCTRLYYENKVDTELRERYAMNHVRILLSQYILELERVLATNSFNDSIILYNIQHVSFITQIFYSTEVLETLLQSFDNAATFVKRTAGALTKRSRVYFDMYFEYYVEKYYKNDEYYQINLAQLSELIASKYNQQRVIMNSQNYDVISMIVLKCHYIYAYAQILKNYLENKSSMHYLYYLTQSSQKFHPVYDLLICQRDLDVELPDWQAELFKYIGMTCFYISSIGRFLLGFATKQLFLKDSNGRIFQFSCKTSSIYTCIISYLDGSLHKHNFRNNETHEVRITQLDAYDTGQSTEEIIQRYRSQLLYRQVEFYLLNVMQAIYYNYSMRLSHAVLDANVKKIDVLLYTYTIYIVEGESPINTLTFIAGLLSACYNILDKLKFLLLMLYRFYSTHAGDLLLQPSEGSSTTLRYRSDDVISALNYLEKALFCDNEFASCKEARSFIYLAILAFKTCILPKIALVDYYYIDVRAIKYISCYFGTAGEYFEEMFSGGNYDLTSTYIKRYEYKYNEQQILEALIIQVRRIHQQVYGITLSLNAVDLKLPLYKALEQIKNVYFKIRTNVGRLDYEYFDADAIKQSYNYLFFECKTLNMIVAQLMQEDEQFGIVRLCSVLTMDYNMWRTLQSYNYNYRAYDAGSGSSKYYVQSFFDFYNAVDGKKTFSIRKIRLTPKKSDYAYYIELPLFEELNCGIFTAPSINPLAHAVYDNSQYLCSDALSQIPQREMSSALEPYFCGFFHQSKEHFSAEANEHSILAQKSSDAKGSYDVLLNALSKLIYSIYIAHYRWNNFSARFLSQGNHIMLTTKSFPFIVDELEQLKYCSLKVKELFAKYFYTYARYYGFAYRITARQFASFYQHYISVAHLDSYTHSEYVQNNLLFYKWPTDLIPEVDPVNQQIFGFEISAYLSDGRFILGVLLANRFTVLFANKILLLHGETRLSGPFLANFVISEYQTSLYAIRIQFFLKLGLVRPNNFMFQLDKTTGQKTSSLALHGIPQLAQLLVSLSNAETALMSHNRCAALKYDFLYRFPKSLSEYFDYETIYALPSSIFFYLFIALITLRFAAYILSESEEMYKQYVQDTNMFIDEMEKRSLDHDDVAKYYFIKVVKFYLLKLNETYQADLQEFVTKMQVFAEYLCRLPRFIKQLSFSAQALSHNNQQDESFADIQVVQGLLDGGKVHERLLDRLDNLEQYVYKAFLIHQLAYELTLRFSKSFVFFGYFEKIPSVSYSLYFKMQRYQDNRCYDLPNEFLESVQAWYIEDSYIFPENAFFDCPFYYHRPFVCEDDTDVFYQWDSFQYVFNCQGNLHLSAAFAQQLEFANFSAVDFYQAFYAMRSLGHTSCNIAVSGINENAVYIMVNLLGRKLMFLSLSKFKDISTFGAANSVIVFYSENNGPEYFYKFLFAPPSLDYVNLIVTPNICEYVQCADLLLWEQYTVYYSKLSMNHKEYALKVVIRYLSIIMRIPKSNLLQTLKYAFDCYCRLNSDQILLNYEKIGTILRNMALRFKLNIETEGLFCFACLLAAGEYEQLNPLLDEQENCYLRAFTSNIAAYHAAQFEVLENFEMKRIARYIILDLEMLGYIRIQSSAQFDVYFVIMFIRFILDIGDYHLMQNGQNYELLATNRAITVVFRPEGVNIDENSQSMQRLRHIISFYQYLVKYSEDELLNSYLLTYFRSQISETGLESGIEQCMVPYCLYVLGLNKIESLLIGKLHKDKMFKLDSWSKPFLVLRKSTSVCSDFPLYRDYLLTPQLYCAALYIRYILHAFCCGLMYNQQVFHVNVLDRAVTVDQIMAILQLDRQLYNAPHVTRDAFFVQFLSDYDFEDDSLLASLNYINCYGIIFVTQQKENLRVKALANKMLLRFDSFIFVNIHFDASDETFSVYNINICRPAGQDVLKILQYHLADVFKRFASLSIVYQNDADVLPYTALFLRQLFNNFESVRLIYLFVSVLCDESSTIGNASRDALIQLFLSSYMIATYLVKYKQENIQVRPPRGFLVTIYRFIVNLPLDIPFYCLELHNSGCNDSVINQWEEALATSYRTAFCNIEYSIQNDNFIVTEHSNGRIRVPASVAEEISVLQLFYANQAKKYWQNPVYLSISNRLYFEFAFQHNAEYVRVLFNTSNNDGSLVNIYNGIIQCIQRNLNKILRKQLQIVLILKYNDDPDMENFIMAASSKNPYYYFANQFKYRLKSVLYITDTEIHNVLQDLFILVVSQPSIQDSRYDCQDVVLHSYQFLACTFYSYAVDAVLNKAYLENIWKTTEELGKNSIDLSASFKREFNLRYAVYHQVYYLFLLLNCSDYEISLQRSKTAFWESRALDIALKQKQQLLISEIAEMKAAVEVLAEKIQANLAKIATHKQDLAKAHHFLSLINAEFQTSSSQLKASEADFNAMKRQIIAFIKSLQNPPGLARRLIDCLALLINVKIMCIQYYFGEIELDFSETGGDRRKMLIIQSTYNEADTYIDAEKLRKLQNDAFYLKKYCFERGYQPLYCTAPCKQQRRAAYFFSISYCDVIYKTYIIESKILNKESGLNTLHITFTSPNDSYSLLSDVINNPSFVDRVLNINPSQITDEYVELLQPFLRSPDFNSLTAYQTSYECFEILRWIHTIIKIQRIYKSYYPLYLYERVIYSEIQHHQTEIDNYQVMTSEYQLQIDNLQTKIKRITVYTYSCYYKLAESHGNANLRRLEIEKIIYGQQSVIDYLRAFVDNYKDLPADVFNLPTHSERVEINVGMRMFDSTPIYEYDWTYQFLLQIPLDVINVKNYLFSSVDPWVSSYLTEEQALQFIKLIQLNNSLIVIDKENQFQIVISRLERYLASIANYLRQLQHYSKINPFYDVQDYNLAIFDSLQAFSLYQHNYRNSLFIVYMTQQELNSAQFQAYIINQDNSNQIVIVISALKQCYLDLHAITFELQLWFRMYIMSLPDQHVCLADSYMSQAAKQYCFFAEMVMCSCNGNQDLTLSARERFIQERSNYIALYRTTKQIFKSYETFSNAVQNLLQLTRFKNEITMHEIMQMIFLCGKSLREHYKFVDDPKYHETVQAIILQELQKHIPINKYAVRYFQLLGSGAVKSAYYYLFFEYFNLSRQVASAESQVDAYLLSRCSGNLNAAKTLGQVIAHLGASYRFKRLAQIMQDSDVFARLAVLAYHYNVESQQGTSHIMWRYQNLKNDLLELLPPEEFYNCMEASLYAPENVSAQFSRYFCNMFVMFSFGFYEIYQQQILQLPSIDYRLPPIYCRTLQFSLDYQVNLSFLVNRQKIYPDPVYALCFEYQNSSICTHTLLLLKTKLDDGSRLNALEEYYTLEGRPHKLYYIILSIDPAVLASLYKVPAALGDYILRTQIDSSLQYSLPVILLAECFDLYVSDDSPFAINHRLHNLRNRILQKLNSGELSLDSMHLATYTCDIAGNSVLFDGTVCQVTATQSNIVEMLINAVQPVVERLSYPIPIVSSGNELWRIRDAQDRWIGALQQYCADMQINTSLTARHDK